MGGRSQGRHDDERQTPIRTCAGCKQRVPQAELVRVIATRAGDAVVDAQRLQPGRGAWVHPREACVGAAGRGGLSRSFRRQVVMGERAKAALLALADDVVSGSGVAGNFKSGAGK